MIWTMKRRATGKGRDHARKHIDVRPAVEVVEPRILLSFVYSTIKGGSTGINDIGQIVGTSHGSSFEDSGGTSIPINDPDADAFQTVANAINNGGQIVGYYTIDAGSLEPTVHGFLDTGGSYANIDDRDALSATVANGINDSGQIVGYYDAQIDNLIVSQGFLDSGGEFRTINYDGAVSTELHDINEKGQIVGIYHLANAPARSFLDSGGVFSPIDYPGAAITWASGINDDGDVVGFYRMSDDSPSHAFLEVGGEYRTIDYPGSASSWATGINNNGVVVGSYTVDSGGLIPEIHGFLASPSPQITSVTAAKNDATAPKTFGNYLINVPLTDTFTVAIRDPSSLIAQVQYAIDGKGPLSATRAGAGSWTFDPKVGALSAAPTHTLVVTALDASGTAVDTYTGTIDIQDDLHETLKITPPGGPSGGEDVTGLRFLQGVALPSQFAGTIADLPSYYVPLLQVELGGKPIDGLTLGAAGSSTTFTFAYDPANLSGDTSVAAFFSTALGTAAVPGSHSSVNLHSVPLPAWLKGVADAYDPVQHQYVLTPDQPLGVNFQTVTADLPAPLGLFNGEKISLAAGLAFSVTAKLTMKEGDAVFTPKSLTASATFLDEPVVDENSRLPLSNVHVTADLDPDTLVALNGVGITSDPINLLKPNALLFDVPFGTGDLILPSPTAEGVISLSGRFQAAAKILSLQVGVELDVSMAQPRLIKEGTFVDLRAQGGVSLVLNAAGSAGFTILPFPLISAVAAGGVSVVADTDLKVNFEGGLGQITGSLNPGSTAGITLGYGFDWNYGILKQVKVSDLKPIIHTVGPYPLIGLKPPPLPDFTDLKNLILSGPGNLDKNGKPVLGGSAPSAPVKTESVLGSSAGSEQAATAADAAAAPTSRLTVVSPVYAPLTGVRFGVTVMADHAALTPGRHFLDTVLVGLDGSEVPISHVDLATVPLSAGGSTLGFASALTGIDAPAGSAPLELGAPHQVEFRLTTDSASTGETVGVVLQDLAVDRPAARLAVTLPGGAAVPDSLDFGPVAGGTGIQTVTVANTGQASLEVSALSLVGAGFALVAPPSSGQFALPPGESIDLQVKLLDPTQPASAALQFTSDDPAQPSYHLGLNYARSAGPVLAPITDRTVRLGRVVRVTALATEPGRVLRYSLDPGAPSGSSINSVTGQFAWTPARPGTYHVTIRVIDDGTPPLSAARTFTILVKDVAPRIKVKPAGPLVQGSTFHETGSYSSTTPGSFTATVNYGDGTGIQSLALTTSRNFTLSHVYARPGKFPVTIRVEDSFGTVGTRIVHVTVTREHRALVTQHLIAPVNFQRSYADALASWRLVEPVHSSPPAGPLASSATKRKQ